MLSSEKYSEPEKNYGDCILIHNDNILTIYDCGSKEHAQEVCKYMEKYNILKANLILSHNDSDHFEGIIHLLKHKKLNSIYTLLLFKHLDELYELIGDKRMTRESLKRRIQEYYDNIYKLGEFNIELKDTLDCINKEVAKGIKILGPNKKITLEKVAKALDSREGDTFDKETIVNAVSTQVEVEKKLFLCGDSCFETIKENVTKYPYIQLPHHGKKETGLKIFEINQNKNNIQYFISDNTGNTNGGSDKLDTKGKNVKNTKDGDIIFNLLEENKEKKYIGCWCKL